MQISLEMGSGYQATKQTLGAMGQAIADACDAGLQIGGQIAAGNVVENYLSGQALKRRSGMLARELDSWPPGSGEVIIGIPEGSPVEHYAWLLSDEQIVITPKKGKFLAIPMGDNLTGAGVPRFTSPRQVPDGFFFTGSSGGLFFGTKPGPRARVRTLFVMKTEVLVQGSGALYDGVMESVPDMTAAIQRQISKVKGVDE